MRADSFFRIDLPATAHCHHHLPTTDAKHRQGTHFVANTLRDPTKGSKSFLGIEPSPDFSSPEIPIKKPLSQPASVFAAKPYLLHHCFHSCLEITVFTIHLQKKSKLDILRCTVSSDIEKRFTALN
ncbi:unnamed protein product [Larinioides sclopetarius]|uniref:Uncharacterized protein n=1 Tax=Larinioides sclopetarius TaxID=280406 RepID=A0AAV1ZP05_9ARAC